MIEDTNVTESIFGFEHPFSHWDEILALTRNDLVVLVIDQSVVVLIRAILVDLELLDNCYAWLKLDGCLYEILWIIQYTLPLWNEFVILLILLNLLI